MKDNLFSTFLPEPQAVLQKRLGKTTEENTSVNICSFSFSSTRETAQHLASNVLEYRTDL
jgi:hypothetical protein